MEALSRKRVIDSIEHKQPDKMAVDFGGTTCSSMSVNIIAGLREHYGLAKKPVEVMDVYTMAGIVDYELQDKLNTDVCITLPLTTAHGFHRDKLKSWLSPWGQELMVQHDFVCTDDGKGGLYTFPQGDLDAPPSGLLPKGGFYFDAIVRGKKISKNDLNPDDNLEEFKIFDEQDLKYLKTVVDKAYETGRAVSYTLPGTGLGDIADIPAVGLKHPKGIRTIEEWYMAPLRFPEYVMEVFDRQMDIAIENMKLIYKTVGDKIQHVVLCGMDLAHQKSLFISPKVFRKVYLPYYQKAINWIHQNTNWKVGKHSCGAVAPLIPLLIEAGFDTLNPVQCSADGMDPKFLKKEFGDHITFWGGGVDTQKTLPFGTTDEVRKEVLERCEIFAPNGGFVFNAIHNIQTGTPIENIVAMLEAVNEFNGA